MHKRSSSHIGKLTKPLDVAGGFEEGGVAVSSPTASGNRRRSSSKSFGLEGSGPKRLSVEWLDDLSDRIRATIPTNEHKNLLRTYKNSFSGEGLCCWLRGAGVAANLTQCIEIGNGLMTNNFILSVDNGKEFKFDAGHFYTIVEKTTGRRASSITAEEGDVPDLKITSLTSLHDVLDNPNSLLKLEKFCEKEHNAENLHFWASVLEFRNQLDGIQDIINTSAESIIDHYVRIGAKQQVNKWKGI